MITTLIIDKSKQFYAVKKGNSFFHSYKKYSNGANWIKDIAKALFSDKKEMESIAETTKGKLIIISDKLMLEKHFKYYHIDIEYLNE